MNTIKAKDFDKKFEAGEDLTNQLDFSKARRVNQESKRVNIDFPLWVVGLFQDCAAGKSEGAS